MKKLIAFVTLLVSLFAMSAFAHEGGGPHHHGDQTHHEQTK